jgi:hypothetical protein
MDTASEFYVVVAENDQPHKMPTRKELFYDDGGPLVFEQYLRSADLESIQKRAEQLNKTYGKCRIAKLQFVDANS